MNYRNQWLFISQPIRATLSDAEHVVRLTKDSENSFSIIGAQSQIEKMDDEMDFDSRTKIELN